MAEDGMDRHDTLISVFSNQVPPELLANINTAIEATRHAWVPPDGRRATAAAQNFAEQLRQLDGFTELEARVCASARRWALETLRRDVPDKPLHILRCVGPRMAEQSYLRHFDSHVLTMLIPLQIAPTGDENGDLILHMRAGRTLPRPAYVVIKAWLFLEHKLPYFIRRLFVMSRLASDHTQRIVCRPGNIYVFNGFVTLHHNLHVAAGERRTLIIHHYDAGVASGLRSTLRALRAMRDRLVGFS